MSTEKCFCHLNGYKVKDADARKAIEDLENNVSETLEDHYNLLMTHGANFLGVGTRLDTIENKLENGGGTGGTGGSSKTWYNITGNPETLVSLKLSELPNGLYYVNIYNVGQEMLYINTRYDGSTVFLTNVYHCQMIIDVHNADNWGKAITILNSVNGTQVKLRPLTDVSELYVYTYDSDRYVNAYCLVEKIEV